MSYRAVINLLPIASGGGLQNALSFLKQSQLDECLVICREGLGLDVVAAERGAEVRTIGTGVFRRIRAEIFLTLSLPSGSTLFTLFGLPPLLSEFRHTNIVGCAYSNLFFPEIDFWARESRATRFWKRAVDWVRRLRVGVADYWIVETSEIFERATKMFSFEDERVRLIEMTAGAWVSRGEPEQERLRPRSRQEPFNVLYLTGPHSNKRIESLLPVACELRKAGEERVKFVLTLDPLSPLGAGLLGRAAKLGVARCFELIGKVDVWDVPRVIGDCDALCNFAVLESFSNNIVEAWATFRPLVITDAPWARAICGDAAVFVDPEVPEEVCSALVKLVDDDRARCEFARRGRRALHRLPSNEERIGHYWEAIGGRGAALTKRRGRYVWRRK